MAEILYFASRHENRKSHLSRSSNMYMAAPRPNQNKSRVAMPLLYETVFVFFFYPENSHTRWLAQFRELRFWHPCFYFVIIFLSKVDESWGLEAEAAWIFPRTQEPRACRPCRDGTDRRQVVRVLTYIICEAGTWRLLEFIPVQAPKMLGCCERACHVPTYSR